MSYSLSHLANMTNIYSHQSVFHVHTDSHLLMFQPLRAQVANTRQPSTLFYPARHLVSTRQQHRAPCPWLMSSYIYKVLKLHSALWRQRRGWCGSRWKWVWHPWLRLPFSHIHEVTDLQPPLVSHEVSRTHTKSPSPLLLHTPGPISHIQFLIITKFHTYT